MKIRSVTMLLLGLAFSTLAQAQQMKKDVVASGGGHSESALSRLDCTIGQVCIGISSSTSSRLKAGFWTGGASTVPTVCDYIQGDINSDGHRIGGDVTYGVRYFKGVGVVPPDSCYNAGLTTSNHWLYVSGDINGDCLFKASDITRLVAYFKGNAELNYCHFFPPPPSLLAGPNEMAPLVINNSLLQPTISPAPIQIKPGIVNEPGKNIKRPPTPTNTNTKDVKKLSVRKI
jgi:hypothetical protein